MAGLCRSRIEGRIEGFGRDGSPSKVWRCTGGHLLRPWVALTGTCDRCGRLVHAGEPVMDCRQCNFYVCTACHPQEGRADLGLWGAVSSLVGAATKEVAGVSVQVEAFVSEVAEQFSDIAEQMSCGSSRSQACCSEVEEFVPLTSESMYFVEEEEECCSVRKSRRAVKSREVVRARKRSGAARRQGQRSRGPGEASGEGASEQDSLLRHKGLQDLTDIGKADLLGLGLTVPPSPTEAARGPEEALGSRAPGLRRVEDFTDIGKADLLDLGFSVPPSPIEAAKGPEEAASFGMPDRIKDPDRIKELSGPRKAGCMARGGG